MSVCIPRTAHATGSERSQLYKSERGPQSAVRAVLVHQQVAPSLTFCTRGLQRQWRTRACVAFRFLVLPGFAAHHWLGCHRAVIAFNDQPVLTLKTRITAHDVLLVRLGVRGWGVWRLVRTNLAKTAPHPDFPRSMPSPNSASAENSLQTTSGVSTVSFSVTSSGFARCVGSPPARADLIT